MQRVGGAGCLALHSDMHDVVESHGKAQKNSTKDRISDERKLEQRLTYRKLKSKDYISLSDFELIQNVKDDRAAAEVLLARYLDDIYGYAYRLTMNEFDAEDLAQDTFLKLWTKAEAWDPAKAGLRTWLYRITWNRFLDTKRKKAPLYGLVEEMENVAITPDLESEAQAALVKEKLDQLPDNQKNAAILHYYQNLPNKQAAEAMGVTLKSYEGLLRRARISLKEMFTD